MSQSSPTFQVRARAASFLVAASALLTAATGVKPGPRSAAAAHRIGVAIAQTTGLHMDPDGVWFERADPLGLVDAMGGRFVLFAASEREGSPKDIWRARVRVAPSGALLGLSGPVNLTVSPLGDDGPVVGDPRRPSRVAFVTRAFGQAQSVALLDTDAQRSPSLRQGLTRYLATLSWRGVSRHDLRLDQPSPTLSVSFEGRRALVRAGRSVWRVDVAAEATTPAEGATLARQQEVEKPLVHWFVDTVRGLSWVGTVPIAWAEQKAFNARDTMRQAAYRWFGVRPEDGSAQGPASAPGEAPLGEGRAITSTVRDESDAAWPPRDVAAPLAATLGRESAEGIWVDASPPWLRRIEGAPSAFYRTWVRLDAQRPYARVVLLAIDLRQVEFGLQAGVEDPVPLVGPRGDGRIPRDPELLGRVVGAFNGAFKTEHGEYGMVVDRRVLLPPRPRAATVAVLDDGRLAMGTWGARSTLPDAVRSLRQNLDPLIADGVENPARRGLWGFVLGGIEHMPTMRSGLCMTPSGAALYVWGEETTARLLGRAMLLAGCSYGMHLDMNPGHAVFQFLRVDDLAARRWQHQSLSSGMHVGSERFLYYSPKDFFYLALRHTAPPPPPEAPWTATARQPAPRWIPALNSARVGDVALTSVSLDRVTLRLRAGRQEPVSRELLSRFDTLALASGQVVLGALELGSASPLSPRGLAIDGRVLMPFSTREGSARIELGEDGLAIALNSEAVGAPRDAVQGRALLVRGEPMGGDEREQAPRLALALTRDRRLLVAEGVTDLGTLRRALIGAGAWSALLVDPTGARPRARWDGEIRDAYAGTTLFVLAAPAPSPVVRLEAIIARSGGGDGGVATVPTSR